MTMQDVVNVLAVAREGSFSGAAQRLYVSQSAISQAIARLEGELGVQLFVRTTRAVQLTAAGCAFVEKGAPVAEAYDRFYEDMRQLARPDGRRLRVGVTSFFSRYLDFQRQVRGDREKYPFDVELVEDSSLAIEQMLLDGRLDIGFIRAPLSSGALRWEPLFTEQLLLAVPAGHPVCREIAPGEDFPAVAPERFRDDPFVMISNARITSNCIKLCQEAGFMPRIAASTVTWERIYDHVAELDLVGFVSCLFVRSRTPDAPVRYFRVDSRWAQLEHVAVYGETLSDSARTYIDAAREFLRLRHLR